MSDQQYEKDPMFNFQSVQVHGKNKKGQDRISYSIPHEDVELFIAAVLDASEKSKALGGNGVKLDFFTTQRQGPRGFFDAGFGFVKAKQPQGAFAAAPKRVTQVETSAETLAKIEALKQKVQG